MALLCDLLNEIGIDAFTPHDLDNANAGPYLQMHGNVDVRCEIWLTPKDVWTDEGSMTWESSP